MKTGFLHRINLTLNRMKCPINPLVLILMRFLTPFMLSTYWKNSTSYQKEWH